MIRRRYLVPSSLEIKYAIRALTITLHTKPAKKGSYEAVSYQTAWLAQLKDIHTVEEMKKNLADKEDQVVNIITGNIDFKRIYSYFKLVLFLKYSVTAKFCKIL